LKDFHKTSGLAFIMECIMPGPEMLLIWNNWTWS